MGGEDGADLRQFIVDVKSAKAAHPLIGMIDHLLLSVKIVIIEALNYEGSSIREHRRLVVITISMQRVNLIVLPQPSVNLILLFEIRYKVYQDGDWFSWHRPSPYPHLKTVILGLPLPIGKERLILPEIGTFLLGVVTVLPFP